MKPTATKRVHEPGFIRQFTLPFPLGAVCTTWRAAENVKVTHGLQENMFPEGNHLVC